jgi:hypothetical protein
LNVRPTRHALVPLAAVAASTALAACHRADSILLVEVAGDLTLHPAALQVMVTAGMQARSFEVSPPAGRTIALPASFSVELDPSLTGPAVVTVEGTDASGFVIAEGTTTQENIDVGGQTILTVTLNAGSGSAIDGGPDGETGEGDGGVADGDAPSDGDASLADATGGQ